MNPDDLIALANDDLEKSEPDVHKALLDAAGELAALRSSVDMTQAVAKRALEERDALQTAHDALSAENATLWKVVGPPKSKDEIAPPPMTEKERALAQKEIQGLTAKLRWPNLDEGMKDVYRARIEALRSKLANPALVS